jgi:hypothetical protein
MPVRTPSPRCIGGRDGRLRPVSEGGRRWSPAARGLAMAALIGTQAAAVHADDESLAQFFGFEETRTVVFTQEFGPLVIADFNGDGLKDMAVVNNRRARLEILTQRAKPKTDQELERDFRVNELPPTRHFDRTNVSLGNRISALVAHDVNGDGRLDIIMAGRQPSELLTLVQQLDGGFKQAGRLRVPDIAATMWSLAVAELLGPGQPQLGVVAGDRIHLYELSDIGPVGEPTIVGTSSGLAGMFVEDFDGDGLSDLLGVYPESETPLRLWLQKQPPPSGRGGARNYLSPEVRLELPAVSEVRPVRFPGRAAASIGVIERATRRVVVYDVDREVIAQATDGRAERDAPMAVGGFKGGADRERSIVIADIDGDGLADLLATHRSANSLVLHRQQPGVGLGQGTSHAALKNPKFIAAGQWDNDAPLEVFVLSEDERTVGVCDYDPSTGAMSVPRPLALETKGGTPVAMNFATLKDGPAVVVVVRDRRDHVLEIHRPGEAVTVRTIPLPDVRRPPQSIIAGDFDDDGFTDLALLTPNEPMVMIRSVDDAASAPEVLNDRTMQNFGLVEAAGPFNTALFDADGDGGNELLIANNNLIRACAFNVEKGWTIVRQIAISDANASLTGLSVLRRNDKSSLVAVDQQNGRLIIVDPDREGWKIADRMRLGRFKADAIHAGSLAGDQQASILAVGEDGYALIRLSGERFTLRELASYRSDIESRAEHRLAFGDVNSDGYLDMVVLDSGDYMLSLFSFSDQRKLYSATEFKVFESRLFSQSFSSRAGEPRAVFVDDVTGDGHADLIVIVHDRVLIYPQQTE